MKKTVTGLFIVCLLCSCNFCGSGATETTDTASASVQETLVVPTFDVDSAYRYTAEQVAFGARVPESVAHKRCADYFVAQLTRFGATTMVQEGLVERYDGKLFTAKNIIASFDTINKRRVLLCAHWDTRPFSDNDPDEANWNKPVLGANDGASGCGVLMEVARIVGQQMPNIGIDIILFDAEDSGKPQFYTGAIQEHTWCLGSQYWARNPHKKNYRAEYGILLDMVGAPKATFYKERFSVNYAAFVVDNIWKTAAQLGYDHYFIDKIGTYIIDDHYYINELAGIPMADIIHTTSSETGFADYWHTQNDTMENVDKETLKAVGQTVLHILYTN
ncbi:MAG: M28 family peptidase [Paludibacteraceae bacterium]|jgi:hypothetical protein|nr:M28 family peptidase [Paludibacteraceae bacterium]MDI9536588.1 M28 family peptidase [Bacteroidota bacterium]OQC34756.1 MAG: Aminopeptidase YwaD precursor [Bacteroidetes bacterium ADurb.Bin057]HHT60731.1 M28 family peptidase [Bacteroidales bacterium]MBP9038773.1 M28 family peptidase [Paludibacteraceae bacterium]